MAHRPRKTTSEIIGIPLYSRMIVSVDRNQKIARVAMKQTCFQLSIHGN